LAFNIISGKALFPFQKRKYRKGLEPLGLEDSCIETDRLYLLQNKPQACPYVCIDLKGSLRAYKKMKACAPGPPISGE